MRSRQRHNDVVVHLRHRRAMPLVTPPAAALAVHNHPVRARRIVPQPAQQRRPEVETHPRVVIHDPRDMVLFILDARCSIGRVALRANAFVPVVIRGGRVLRLYRLQPRILAWRLIEMPMNADESFRWWHRPSSFGRELPGFSILVSRSAFLLEGGYLLKSALSS